MRITDPKCVLYGTDNSFEERKNFFANLMGDKLRYSQILLNFLSNAIKFTQEGKSITVRVVILDLQNCNNASIRPELQSHS